MKYKDEIIRSMEWLADKDDTIFFGQSVLYSGNAIYNTLKTLQQEDKMIQREFERNKISTTNNFNETYRVIVSKNDSEIGDNIILPQSASNIISKSEKPYVFEIKGTTTRIYGKKKNFL